MIKFIGFRLRGQQPKAKAIQTVSLPPAHTCIDAQSRVMDRVRKLGEGFFTMPVEQYGQWVDALPRDEFIEFVALANT